MPEKKNQIRRETLVEKLMRRSLETVGGSVDSVFGRGKKPDALPATSDLAQRLRKLIDAQAQINRDGRKLAPHLIQLRYAWGQTSDEFEVALKRLKNELLIVAIDFINDNRFATLAPVKIEAKADILTVGFTMSIGFDAAGLRDAEAVEIPIEIYAKLLPDYQADLPPASRSITVNVTATFPDGKTRDVMLNFVPEKKTTLTVGRIKEVDLYLDDESVSKHHASLVMSNEGVLRVADIGSTNGTFLDGTRIAYGKAYEIEPETTIGFGDVKTNFSWEIPQPETPESLESETLSDDLSEMSPKPEISESGFDISVKSTASPTDEIDELTVVSGAISDNQNEPEESTIINRQHSENEPETVNKRFEVESKSLETQITEDVQALTTLKAEPKSNLLTQAETTVNQMANQSSETRELSDFTQSLDTNPLEKDFIDKNLLEFKSLRGTSNAFLGETNELTEVKKQSSEKP